MITNHRIVLIHLILMLFLQQSKLSSTDSPKQLFLNRYIISRQIIYSKFPKMRRIIYPHPLFISKLIQFHIYNINFIYSYKINIMIILGQTPYFLKYQPSSIFKPHNHLSLIHQNPYFHFTLKP